MRKQLGLTAVLAAIGFKGHEVKESAADRRDNKSKYGKHYQKPRSMTPAEKDYYDKHKSLQGFYS